MGITTICCCIYMWLAGVKDAPLGKPEVRLLLLARGVTGFTGGMWSLLGPCHTQHTNSSKFTGSIVGLLDYIFKYAVSLIGSIDCLVYLPMAEAVVITFLAPIIACWACSILVNEPFTRMEQIAAFLSFVGVVFIAQPTSIFGTNMPSTTTVVGNEMQDAVINATSSSHDAYSMDGVTPTQRLVAVCVGLFGACGAAGAYTTIRWIGNRAHPLISVNYFAIWCTIISTVALALPGGAEFRIPSTLHQWSLLIFLGICGFVMQFLLTAGLSYEKSSRPTQMVYTQMLFALAFDKIIWGTTPGMWSLAGSSLILGSALYVAVKGDAARADAKSRAAHTDEETGLIAGVEHIVEVEDGEDARELLRGIPEVQLGTLRV